MDESPPPVYHRPHSLSVVDIYANVLGVDLSEDASLLEMDALLMAGFEEPDQARDED